MVKKLYQKLGDLFFLALLVVTAVIPPLFVIHSGFNNYLLMLLVERVR